MADFDLYLAKAYLERQGCVVALSVPAPGQSESKLDEVIDLFAVKLEDGRAVSAIIGCVKGWWQGKRHLTPSVIHQLGEPSGILDSAFSETKIEYARGLYHLGDVPTEKLLFFPQRSPQKAVEAEKILQEMEIKPVYLADLIAGMLPKLRKELAGNPLGWLTDLRRMRNSPLVLESINHAKAKKDKSKAKAAKAVAEDDVSPQLSFFTKSKSGE